MSYFEFTHADLAKQRAAGIQETKKEVGESLLALANDTVVKMNDETLDSGYVAEDLIGRLVEMAKRFGADVTLFPETERYENHTYAYPIVEE